MWANAVLYLIGDSLPSADLWAERAYVARLYQQLDRMRKQAAGRWEEMVGQSVDPTRMHGVRDAAAAGYKRRLVQCRAAEHGLCFGGLDLCDGERRYIGRIGICDEATDN